MDSPLASNSDQSEIRAAAAAVPVSDEIRRHELANMVRQLFYRARDSRRPLVTQWKKNYRVLNNRTWSPRAEPWMPAPEVSNIWPLVASLVAWMTDQRPGFESVPGTPPFSQYADYYDRIAQDMNALLEANYSMYQEDAEVERILWDMATYRIGYAKTIWEPWLADGLGDSVFRRVDPFTIYPDPHAHNEFDANYIVEAKIMSLDDVDRAWPGAKRLIQGNVNNSEDVDIAPTATDAHLNPLAPRVNLNPVPPSTSPRFGESQRSNILNHEDPVVVVLEAWIRYHEVITPDQDDSLAPGTARVVDRWKCVVVCGNTVLMEKWADEIYGHNRHPYSRMVLFDTGDWYGPGLVEFLTSPQESINRLLQTMEHNLLLLGNPVFMSNARTNRGGRPTITNRPGQRVEGDKQKDGWLEPPPLHPDFINLIQYYESKLETISGLSAIMRGFSPTGRNSEDVMSSVQDSAFVRVRATLRNLERMLRNACSLQMANIAEFYTEPRIVSLLGPDGTQTAKALKARHFYTLPNEKGEQGVPLRFTLLTDAGADHPTSRQARQAQAERLFAMGAIDTIEVLKAERWPNWPIVANRVMEMQAMAGTLGQPPGARQRTRRS
jgi:hypothetical protein